MRDASREASLFFLFSENAFFRHGSAEGKIVRLSRNGVQPLRLKGGEDRRGARAAGKIAVVIPHPVAETAERIVEAHAGDKDGVELDSVGSVWNARALQAYEVCALKDTAPTSAAVDMRFYVRRGR